MSNADRVVPDPLARIARQSALVLVVLIGTALAWRPTTPSFALGVAGGGGLIGLSYWAIRGMVEALTGAQKPQQNRGRIPGWPLVKFFTRHAILALAAYGMMTRLHFDPIGILIGVSAPGLVLAREALRGLRRPTSR